MNYRRARVPGGTYFFTVALRDRRSRMLTDHIDALLEAVQCAKWRWPFRIDAFVVLPDHLHTMWTLPEGDADFSQRWRAIKARFTRYLVKEGIVLAQDRCGEYELWQRRFWEHLVRDEEDFARHVDYTFTTSRSSMVRWPGRWIGAGPRSIATFVWGCSRPIGPPCGRRPVRRMTPGFRCAPSRLPDCGVFRTRQVAAAR